EPACQLSLPTYPRSAGRRPIGQRPDRLVRVGEPVAGNRNSEPPALLVVLGRPAVPLPVLGPTRSSHPLQDIRDLRVGAADDAALHRSSVSRVCDENTDAVTLA